ncbi:uncharacterized protein HD556DRAFT_1441784 [Suillus plorans]|uniref:Uncharacterized protein n=1 Tax=Suillus plorans TaxID=116603 RepID=A0A9P7DJN7_9AGAM|nr:uncharacterized protein HD556DRAFT_1441784 [Suillus plorans]KAG1795954.1 hypothetical protein HD556DRAFT_1441784 [Suillus plorans]
MREKVRLIVLLNAPFKGDELPLHAAERANAGSMPGEASTRKADEEDKRTDTNFREYAPSFASLLPICLQTSLLSSLRTWPGRLTYIARLDYPVNFGKIRITYHPQQTLDLAKFVHHPDIEGEEELAPTLLRSSPGSILLDLYYSSVLLTSYTWFQLEAQRHNLVIIHLRSHLSSAHGLASICISALRLQYSTTLTRYLRLKRAGREDWTKVSRHSLAYYTIHTPWFNVLVQLASLIRAPAVLDLSTLLQDDPTRSSARTCLSSLVANLKLSVCKSHARLDDLPRSSFLTSVPQHSI